MKSVFNIFKILVAAIFLTTNVSLTVSEHIEEDDNYNQITPTLLSGWSWNTNKASACNYETGGNDCDFGTTNYDERSYCMAEAQDWYESCLRRGENSTYCETVVRQMSSSC